VQVQCGIPAVFNERWAHDAAIFYTFEAMGVLDKLHRPFFRRHPRDHAAHRQPAGHDRMAAKNGVDAKKFYDTMKSFSVQSKTRRAVQLTHRIQDRRHAGNGVQGPLHRQHRAGA